MMMGAKKKEQKENGTEPSVGEKWWHRLTYTGVGYLLNVAVSIAVWDYFISAGGRPVFNSLRRTTGSESFSKFFFSSLGGHIVTFGGVKPLEDKAGYVTHKFNQWFDKDYKYKNVNFPEGTPDEDYPALSDPPNKNNLLQVAMRRGLGQAAIIGSGMGLRTIGLEKPIEEGFARGMLAMTENSGIEAVQRLGRTPIMKRYSKLLGLEATLTIVTAAVTMLTKNSFGKKKGESDLADDAGSVDVPGITENGHGHSKAFAKQKPARREFQPSASHAEMVSAQEPGASMGLQH